MSHAHQAEPQYLGVPIFFAGRTWLVPSLSVKQFREHYDALVDPIEGNTKEAVDKRFEVYIPIIGAALRRNYPELKDEQLLDELDLHTFGLVIRAVQNASGMKVVKPGEAETQTAP